MDRPRDSRCSEWVFLMQARTILMLTLSAALVACGDPCTSEVILASQSPSGLSEALFTKANCGATTGYRYDIRISKKGELAGDTAIRFDDNHACEWVENEKLLLDILWLDDKNLKIQISKPIRIFEEESYVNGVTIRYKFADGSLRV